MSITVQEAIEKLLKVKDKTKLLMAFNENREIEKVSFIEEREEHVEIY